VDNDGPGEKLALEAYQKLANASGKKIAGIASACYIDETGRFLHYGDANKQFLTISCPDNYEEVGNQGDHHEPWANADRHILEFSDAKISFVCATGGKAWRKTLKNTFVCVPSLPTGQV
jgi:hypothetical protein